MIVVLSNADDPTADFLQTQLAARGLPFLRLNTERLPDYALNFSLGRGARAGWIEVEGVHIATRDLDAVYYRRPRHPDLPELPDPALAAWVSGELRRSWGGLLASLPLFWMNHPLRIDQASDKPEQLVRAQHLGLLVPETLITTEPAEARAFCETLAWDVVVKPIGSGTVRGLTPDCDQLVYTTGLEVRNAGNLERVRGCPTLFQRRLHRDTDIRVTIVGGRCFAADLRLPTDLRATATDCRRDNMQHVMYAPRELPTVIRNALIQLTRSYNLEFAAIDLILDTDGTYWFLELNPAGQWAWIEEYTGLPIAAAIADSLAAGGTVALEQASAPS